MVSYIGGKSLISKWIIPHIPNDIETYVEPFGGMFWVYFNMDLTKYPNLNKVVYNDFNSLNTNLFKCVKRYDELYEELSKLPIQKKGVIENPILFIELFNKFQKEIFSTDLVITEQNSMDIACKYLYVLTQIYSGTNPTKSKMIFLKGNYTCKLYSFMNKLKNKKYQDKFNKITFVENLDFGEVIKKYDDPKTYFYVDPPYYKTEKYYSNHKFDITTHYRLAETLKNIKGQFSLSYYDFEELTNWFPKDIYNWKEQEFKKQASSKKIKNKSIELLIYN